MTIVALALLLQVAPAAPASSARPAPPASGVVRNMRPVSPVLAFPEPGLDDSAAYQGYRTRFFRDAAGNTLQIYLDRREARVVHLWADAENESIGFTAVDASGAAVPLRWNEPGARVGRAGRTRSLEHRLVADGPIVRLGHFVMGTMRAERDVQYWKRHRAPLDTTPFVLQEVSRLLAALDEYRGGGRMMHIRALNGDVATLRARVVPSLFVRANAARWTLHVVQPSLDGRDTITLEIGVDPRRVQPERAGNALTLRARAGDSVPFTVRVTTTGRALTPLTRTQIFTPAFLRFVADAQRAGARSGDSAAIRARWLERQVRGVELLVSREKLMAGLPTYATYFGRDMLVSTLMMRPIWRDDMSAFAIAAALRKLSPTGQVSHEEALGGQAVREAAAQYADLMEARARAAAGGNNPAADSIEDEAVGVLRGHRRVRENYHMIDDELQLAVLAGRWLADPNVPAARRRAFLLDSSDGGGTRLTRLLRELALVARMTDPYAREPRVANLIAFASRGADAPGRWASTSWRDSNAGYGNGRWAMDVNAIWAPHALEGVARILAALDTLGLAPGRLANTMPDLAPTTPLGRWLRDPAALRAATDTWWDASRHFVVRLAPDSVRARVAARLAAMPTAERAHWTRVLATTGADRDSLSFLAVALDSTGRPNGVANTDPATRLFLGDRPGASDAAGRAAVLRDVRTFARAYPVGLFIDRVGPVVANDAYAAPAIWNDFVRDAYHGPRVAWGREVNLFLLGVAGHVASARSGTDPATTAYITELRDAASRVQAAVEASGFQSELWSYDFVDGRPTPVRYGSGADVQLWSTTDLVVQFALSRIGNIGR